MDSSKGKSKLVTYFLWLVGGLLGLHHFYLGRDLHGFLWWCTFGGYFGCGWIQDAFRINEYVKDANEDREYLEKIKEIVRLNKKPPFSTTRFTSMVVVGYYWCSVFHYAIPEEEIAGINWKWLYLLNPFACSLGIWAVGNVGHQMGGLKAPVLAAYLCLPLKYFMDESSAFTIMVLAAAIAFDSFEKKWRPRRRAKTSNFWRMLKIGFCALLFCSMICSYVYFNGKIVDEEGEEIPVREAFSNFLKSPWWTDLKQTLWAVWSFAQQHGWVETWKQMIDISDPYGENNAYKVLDISSMASQSEINSKCRSLAVKYHPDKAKTENDKKIAQEKFYEVQQACEVLSSSRMKRRKKNKKYDTSSHTNSGNIEL